MCWMTVVVLGTSWTAAAVQPLAFEPLPLGEIAPEGWLKTQLRIQADGLSGHLDEFWPDVRDSGWIGGDAEGWERGPYWLDGIVPLAVLLDDPKLMFKVQKWMNYILEHQTDDGWFGPLHGKRDSRAYPYDPWPTFIFMKALRQFVEATGDARAIPAMLGYAQKLDAVLSERPLFEWGEFRWMDSAVTLLWLYNRTNEPFLLDLVQKLRDQGYDWQKHFLNFTIDGKVDRAHTGMHTHVVNNAMGLKAPAAWYWATGDATAKRTFFEGIDNLDRLHGQATGLFTGDEHFAGRNPSQGTELCAVVEYMYSLETAISILGEPALGDRLERIGFNALPAAFKPDMWAHQYDQQANQVISCIAENPIYGTNGPDANLFGLEPNYGCCTANYHQGWPKFASHLWMKSPDSGLAAIVYAPCTITATLNGDPVTVEVRTEYPFRSTVDIAVKLDAPMHFPLRLRIPGWADGATVAVAGGDPEPVAPGEFHIIDRTWHDGHTLTLELPMPIRIERRFNGSVSILRGPLVYVLRIGENWRHLRGDRPHADWEVHPTTPWNYALQLDLDAPSSSVVFNEKPLGIMPFSPEGAPVVAEVHGRRVPEWVLVQDAAGPLPNSPVRSDEPLDSLQLIPYGCSNLRLTEFPLLATEP